MNTIRYILAICTVASVLSATAQDQKKTTSDSTTVHPLYPEVVSLYKHNRYVSLCGGFKAAFGRGLYGFAVDIRPRVGYFVANRFLAGVDATNTFIWGNYVTSKYSFLGGIFSRYYIGKRGHFFAEAEYHMGNYCSAANFMDNKIHSIVSYGAGARVHITKSKGRFYLEIDFKGYSYLDNSECSHAFILGMLGVSYTIKGKKAKQALGLPSSIK